MNPNLERTKAGRSHADVMRECEEHSLSHASLIAEVTALRASLGDAVKLVESLRADRDALRAACIAMVKCSPPSNGGLFGYMPDSQQRQLVAQLRAALGRSA